METLKTIEPILNLIVIFIILFVYFSSKTYWKSYVTERAKSDVQKKDIEDLTQKVESVKAIYTRENEIIKYKLSQLLSLKEQHRSEERNALIKFHAAYIHWIFLLQGVNLSDYNSNNLNELLEKKLCLNDYFYNIHVERANVLLIVDNAQIIAKTYDLIQKLIEYKSFVEKELLALQFLLTDNNDILQSFLKLNEHYEKNKQELQKIADEDTENRNKIETSKNNYHKRRTDEFLKCRTACDEFATIAKNYLISIDG